MNPESDEFLTVAQAAKRLCVTKTTIQDWIKAGKMTAYRVGGRYRIKPADADAMIEPVGKAAL